MKKFLLFILVVVAIGGGLYIAKVSGPNTKTSDSNAPKLNTSIENTDLSPHIPADTLFWILNTSPIDTQALFNTRRDPSTDIMLAELQSGEAGSQFLAHIATQWIESGTQGLETFQKDWGFANNFQSAFYTVGLVPVAEIIMARPAQFIKQIDTAANAAGIIKSENTTADASIHSYALPNDEIANLALSIKQSKNSVRITFTGPFNEELNAQILGSKLPAKTLDSQNTIELIRKQHGFKGNVLAAFQWDNLSKVLTDKDNMAFSMLNTLSKGKATAEFTEMQSQECQTEVSQLINFMPRTLLANQVDIKDGRIYSEGTALLELTNSWFTGNLSKINGVLPAFSLEDDYQPMLGLALGLNLKDLAPSLQDIWGAIAQYEPKCKALLELKSELIANDPSLSLGILSMISTVQGLSLTINEMDLELHNEMPHLSKLSAVLSLSSISATQLIGLAQTFQPMLAAMKIPSDGTSQPLQLPFQVPGLPELVISVQSNKHIVISTTDELATKQTQSLAKQDLSSNGISMLAMQSKPFTHILQKVQKQMSTGLLGSDSVEGGTCAELNLYTAAAMDTDINLNLVTRFAKEGLRADIKQSQLVKKASKPFKPGKYKVWQITDGCHKVVDGEDIFNADGTGSLSSVIDHATCDGYNAKYTWKSEAGKLQFHFNEEQFRSTCSEPLSDWQKVTEGENRKSDSCFLFNQTEDSFSCIFVTDDIPTQYDFKKMD